MKGTYAAADITIYHVKRKERIQEPSYVAYEVSTGKVLAIGEDAENMLCDGNKVKCVSPFHQGIVAIAKDNLEEYAKELLEETCDIMREWGISKEQMILMLEE